VCAASWKRVCSRRARATGACKEISSYSSSREPAPTSSFKKIMSALRKSTVPAAAPSNSANAMRPIPAQSRGDMRPSAAVTTARCVGPTGAMGREETSEVRA